MLQGPLWAVQCWQLHRGLWAAEDNLWSSDFLLLGGGELANNHWVTIRDLTSKGNFYTLFASRTKAKMTHLKMTQSYYQGFGCSQLSWGLHVDHTQRRQQCHPACLRRFGCWTATWKGVSGIRNPGEASWGKYGGQGCFQCKLTLE